MPDPAFTPHPSLRGRSLLTLRHHEPEAVAAILAYAPRKRRNLVQGVGCAVIFALLMTLAVYRTLDLLI